MNLKCFLILLVVSIMGLSACSRNTPPADSLPIPAPTLADNTGASVPAEPAPTVNPLADFTVDPGVVFACDGRDRTISSVKWQVKDPSVITVEVQVDTAEESARKTFAAGGATGEAITGEWVVNGVRFHLVDAATQKELASYEVTSLPCQ